MSELGVLGNLGIEKGILGKNMVIKVLNFLISMGVVIEVSNITDISDKKYYVTNPSIVNMVYSSIINEIKGFTPKNKSVYNPVLGLVFESVAVCHAYYMAVKKNNNVYFYRKDETKEIDIIEEIVNEDPVKDNVFNLYEFKLMSDKRRAKSKSKWLFDEEIESDIKEIGILGTREIVYLGESDDIFKSGEEFLLERS